MARLTSCVAGHRGATLIEALVVMALFSAGMVGLTQLQTRFGAWAEDAQLRAEAVRHARQKLDELRAYQQVPASPDATSFEGGVVSSPSSEPLSAGTTTFHRSWAVHDDGNAHHRIVVVTINWDDRSGAQALRLPTLIARQAPNSVGRLQLPPDHELTTSLPHSSSP